MKKQFIVLLLFCLSFSAFAQTINVKGVVKDAATGDVLPGVSILIKGTTTGTETDFDGVFTIRAQKGQTLVFNYLGYQQKEVVVNESNIEVGLKEAAEALDEIVVIGYGTQSKKEVTGAVSVVGSATIEDLKPTRIEQALQGQVAGVNITQNSGSPGAASNIRIRGISTNGDSRPLILLDGRVIEDLSVVNPNDIESINILKDAAAGIYGVRAANGVILVTTKTGRKNSDLRQSVNMYTGFQVTTREIPVLNATEYALLANEAFAANGEALPFPNIDGLGQGTDWQSQAFSTAPIFSLDYTANKGTDKSAYSLGVSFLTQDGIVGGSKSNFNRSNIRFNYDTDLTDKLKFNSSTVLTNTNKRNLVENTLGSVLFNAVNMPPTTPVRDVNGDFSLPPVTGTGIEVANPLAQVDNAQNRNSTYQISGSYGLTYEIDDYFTAETRFQANYSIADANTFNRLAFYGNGNVFNVDQSTFVDFRQSFFDYTFDAFLKYERVFNDVHDFKALLATSVFKTTGRFRQILTRYAYGTTLNNVSFAGPVLNGDGLEIYRANNNGTSQSFDSRLLSYMARFQYAYDGKYLVSAVVRRDASSNFGPENKFGYFPTASLGWVASEEDFLKDSNILSFAKLRASYGIIGNDRIPGFRFVSILNGEAEYVFNNQLAIGTAIGPIANPEIRWEQQRPLDIGVDLELFDKIDITADYFKKTTEDLLVSAQTSGIIGVAAPGSSVPVVNAGTVENSGFEFSIGYSNYVNDDFNYKINYNFTTLNNEVTFVGNSTGIIEGGSFGVGQDPPSRMEAGFPIGYFYGYKTDGIFQTQAEVDAHPDQVNAAPGDLRFVDVNGDGVINADDRTYIGDPIADLTMGLNLSFNYKNWDFNAYAFASIGNEIVRNYERNLPLTNRPAYFLDRWTGPGSTNSFPRVTTGATPNVLFSDFYVEDGSFMRLQSMQIGYTFGQDSLDKLKVDKLRFYLSATNLFTITNYRGFDPTTSNGAPIGGGIDQGFYPNPRTFLFGLNLNF